MNKPDFNRFLNQELEQLNQEIEPKRDLYAGIEKALSRQQQSKQPFSVAKLSAIAASFCALMVAATWFYMAPAQSSLPIAQMESMFQHEKQALLVQYSGQDPLIDDWQNQLKVLEDAELAVKKALEEEPNNAVLLRMLAQVYQQQLDLINKVHKPKWQTI